MRIRINDVEVAAQEGQYLLDVARNNGFEIPSLCHHEALPPIGACRICLVEVTNGKQTKLTTSCNTLVEPGLDVITDSTVIQEMRRTNIELLLARAPSSPRLRELAGRYGINRPRFKPIEDVLLPDCILCELCVRTCESLGHQALAAIGRGDRKRIGLAFNKPSETCVGCGSCSSVCPTGCIRMRDTATSRTIWGQSFGLVLCKECHAPVITEKHRAFAIAHKGLAEDYYDVCESCKQRASGQRFASVVW